MLPRKGSGKCSRECSRKCTRECPPKLAFSCYNPIQRLPLECSRECSRGCPRKCTRSGLVICHLVCFHLLCSLPTFQGILLKPAISRVKLAKFLAKLVANFRRSLEGDFRASLAGEIVRNIFHQNSTTNFTIKFTTRFWVVAGPISF